MVDETGFIFMDPDKQIISFRHKWENSSACISKAGMGRQWKSIFLNGFKIRVRSTELVEVDTEITFDLKKPIPLDVQLISLSYKDPKRDQRNGVIQDEFGNDYPGINAMAVELI